MKNLGFSNPGTILLPLRLRDDTSNHTCVLKDLMPSLLGMLVGTYKVTHLKSCGVEEGKPRNPDQVDGALCVGLITNNSQLVRAVQSGMGCLRK